MNDFLYRRPDSLAEALARLSAKDGAKLLAGGMTLIPTLKHRLAAPAELVDLGGIAALRAIRAHARGVELGAMATHATVAGSSDVRRSISALALLAAGIGDAQVRHRGTIGGSIANHDPAADYPAACVGLAAIIVTDRREIPADDFFTGLFSTALRHDEVITSVRFPAPKRAAYMKFANPASRYAMVGVFVAELADGIRVAVTGAGRNGVFRAQPMERALAGAFAPESLDGVEMPEQDLMSDMHASAAYRAHLIGVMAGRAVAAACGAPTLLHAPRHGGGFSLRPSS